MARHSSLIVAYQFWVSFSDQEPQVISQIETFFFLFVFEDVQIRDLVTLMHQWEAW